MPTNAVPYKGRATNTSVASAHGTASKTDRAETLTRAKRMKIFIYTFHRGPLWSNRHHESSDIHNFKVQNTCVTTVLDKLTNTSELDSLMYKFNLTVQGPINQLLALRLEDLLVLYSMMGLGKHHDFAHQHICVAPRLSPESWTQIDTNEPRF